MARIRIGISGWNYAPWRGDFYPAGLTQRRELEYAASRFRTLEVNGTFYSLQRPSSFAGWRERTPPDTVFALKGGRFVTHLKRLRDVHDPLANFFASGVLALGPKLGPFLWQLPPTLAYDEQLLAEFLDLLPRDTQEASALAARHDHRIADDQAVTTAELAMPLRHAVEVRHDSFADEAAIACFRSRGVALVVADAAGKWPLIEEMTADFAYLRLHGHQELYASGYPPEALDTWASKALGWQAAGLDVFVYFDNDIKVRAPYDAMALMRRCGVEPPDGAE